MMMNVIMKETGLTKKAVEYYIAQGLVSPEMLENGYRNFSMNDCERLKRTAILRKLDVSTDDIAAILQDESREILKRLSLKKELNIQRDKEKTKILDQLGQGISYTEIQKEIDHLDSYTSAMEKLMNAFPGYYGRFICLNFSTYLKEPLITPEQNEGFMEAMNFLDSAPSFEFPEDLQEYLMEGTKNITMENMEDMIQKTHESIANPEKFMEDNKEVLEYYLAYLQTDEYQNSQMNRMNALIKNFHKVSGYYDIFIPAMKKISPQYAKYHIQMEEANKKLLEAYPKINEIEHFSN